MKRKTVGMRIIHIPDSRQGIVVSRTYRTITIQWNDNGKFKSFYRDNPVQGYDLLRLATKSEKEQL